MFSPELDLVMDEPSMTANADRDILPWNIPTSAYLHGRRPDSGPVSAVDQEVSGWPPTFVSYGGDEMFRDAIRRFVAHLEEAGVDTVASEEPGVPRLPHPDAVGRRQSAGLPGVGQFIEAHLEPSDPDPS